MGVKSVLAAVAVRLLALGYGVSVLCGLLLQAVRRPRLLFTSPRHRTEPSCLRDSAYGKHQFVQLKNVKLHYVEKGDRKKPLMVFLHGFPEFWFSWRYQILEFSKDYWTVAVDMRGYGESDKPEGPENYRMKDLVDDVKELVEKLGRDKFILVGHDWGGVVSWGFVYTYPQMLLSYVILDGPPPDVWLYFIVSSLSQFLKSWYVFFFQLPYLPEYLIRFDDMGMFDKIFAVKGKPSKASNKYVTYVQEEDLEAYKYVFSQPGALTPPINYYRNLLHSRKPSARRKMKLDDMPPGLFVFGEHEQYLHMDTLDHARDQINNLTTAIAKGCNHFVQQDDPVQVNQLMADFLRQHKL